MGDSIYTLEEMAALQGLYPDEYHTWTAVKGEPDKVHLTHHSNCGCLRRNKIIAPAPTPAATTSAHVIIDTFDELEIYQLLTNVGDLAKVLIYKESPNLEALLARLEKDWHSWACFGATIVQRGVAAMKT